MESKSCNYPKNSPVKTVTLDDLNRVSIPRIILQHIGGAEKGATFLAIPVAGSVAMVSIGNGDAEPEETGAGIFLQLLSPTADAPPQEKNRVTEFFNDAT
jgi:hypothetical protein